MAYFQSKNPTIARALVEAMLAALSVRPAGSLLTTPTVHLYSSVTPPISPISAETDFTECTFTGYAAATLTFSAPVLLPSGQGYAVLANATFIAGAVTPPGQNALGYWINDTATNVYVAEAFPSPIPFAALGSFLDLTCLIPIATPASAI